MEKPKIGPADLSTSPEVTEDIKEVIIEYVNRLKEFDPVTYQHSLRTARKCTKVAHRFYGNDPELREELSLAGLLHDCGKEEVGQEIVLKPGPLDDQERGTMNEHSRHAFERVKKFLPRVAMIILLHHGEPRSGNDRRRHPRPTKENGRRAIEAPPELRRLAHILSIVDVEDALFDPGRPYKEREVWPLARVRDELLKRFKALEDQVIIEYLMQLEHEIP